MACSLKYFTHFKVIQIFHDRPYEWMYKEVEDISYTLNL